MMRINEINDAHCPYHCYLTLSIPSHIVTPSTMRVVKVRTLAWFIEITIQLTPASQPGIIFVTFCSSSLTFSIINFFFNN
jgi:hypothetical protein